MSIKTKKGYFKQGLPQGEVKIKLNNFAEITGPCRDGVLHGKVVIKNKNEGLIFRQSLTYSIGRYFFKGSFEVPSG